MPRVIDQYQLHTDPRSQFTSDPNRPDVSLETTAIVNQLPAQYAAKYADAQSPTPQTI